jgi:hypothetical protein
MLGLAMEKEMVKNSEKAVTTRKRSDEIFKSHKIGAL